MKGAVHFLSRYAAAAGLILMLIAVDASLQADTVFFKDGMRLDVERAWEENGEVCVEMYGSVCRFPKENIRRIETPASMKSEADLEKSKSRQKDQAPSTAPMAGKVPEAGAAAAKTSDPKMDYAAEVEGLAQAGKWREAIEAGNKARQILGKEGVSARYMADLHVRLAADLCNKGACPEALDNLKTALDYSPDYAPATRGMAGVYLTMAQQKFSMRDYDGAAQLLKNAVSHDADNAQIYLLHGQIAYAKDEYTDAQHYWRKALSLKPDLTVAAQHLKQLDKDWQVEQKLNKAESGGFSVKFEGSKKQSVADKAVSILEKAHSAVGATLDMYPSEKIIVIIYPRSDLQGMNYVPDWAAGIYDGKIRFAEDLFEGDYYTAILYHEYTHAVVHALGGRWVPLWLQEGLAEYMSRSERPDSLRQSQTQLLKSAAGADGLIPIQTLARMNVASLMGLNRQHIQLVYAQSESFVTYLINQYSTVSIRSLVIALGKGEEINRAVARILGSDLAYLEQQWRKSMAN